MVSCSYHCYALICNNLPNLKYLPQFVLMKLPQCVTMFVLTCNTTILPEFVAQACLSLQCIYIFDNKQQ